MSYTENSLEFVYERKEVQIDTSPKLEIGH